MNERRKFVSGLPGDPKPAASLTLQRATSAADPAGLAILQHIRARALADSAVLAPLCIRRFDGAEWLLPDATDIEAKAAADATVALVDGIMADVGLVLRVAAMLARGKQQ